MIEILRCSTHTRPKELSENDTLTTSLPRGFSHEDAWVNAQLRNPSVTTKLAPPLNLALFNAFFFS